MMSLIRFLTSLFLVCFAIVPAIGQTTTMTFNIRYDNPDDGKNAWSNRKTEVVKLIATHAPDIIGLQEALPNQVSYIHEHLDGYSFIGHGRDGVNTNSEATPIFYNNHKFELLDQKLFWLSETPEEISKGWDAALNRIALYGKFRNMETGVLLHILNTHLDHRGETARRRSAELLLDFIRKKELEGQQIVLMGDFNAIPEASSLGTLKKLLFDAREVVQQPASGPEATFNGFDTDKDPDKRIDYIFVKNLSVKTYQCIDSKRKNGLYPSDHFPIIISF
ncbi:endonuclease/exonuclease/phosphatase family protein [Robertkochia flava]|uniref:endonuclease/exonuclease/phosphatase family protein n=1 Tax=Robertkochia flava TaxID=3447986 RepID=UPI001CCBC75E|nr:endonuclease/exonuclease/phosphatase family protein [Robertkochia marina]